MLSGQVTLSRSRRPGAKLDSLGPAFSGSDADGLVDAGDEDLAVADSARAGRFDDGLHRTLHQAVIDNHLDLHLRQEVHHVLRTAIELGVSLLAPKSLGFGYGDPLDAYFVKGFLHLIKLEGLDDRFDLLHGPGRCHVDRILDAGCSCRTTAPGSDIADGMPSPGEHLPAKVAACRRREQRRFRKSRTCSPEIPPIFRMA